ncbi:MAG: hypothetical protein ACYDHH_33345 [Solirubrobacteraceae bacterium]
MGSPASLRLQAQTAAITGSVSSRAWGLGDAWRVPADAVALAAGVPPDVQLTRDAGLTLERAVLVHDELGTSSPGAYTSAIVQHGDATGS